MARDLFRDAGAVLSSCGRYRYHLWRSWADFHGPRVLWVMLNPSTADSELDDPTIRRCMAFSSRWGYHGCEVVNLFAWRATDPRELRLAADPVGPANDPAIKMAAEHAALVVAAWGNHGSERANAVLDIICAAGHVPKVLGLNRNGSPKHPLYLPSDASPVVWATALEQRA